jgi:DNA-binding PadR family transcriptional regulator
MLRDHSVAAYVLKALIENTTMSFVELKRHLSTTDGNLYYPIQRLLKSNFIEKVPTVDNVTVYRITNFGRMAFNDYVKRLIS